MIDNCTHGQYDWVRAVILAMEGKWLQKGN